ncbi:hypothetical protein DFH09DRAFT_1088262 [Mycena vulgaris]|nr:hypothetical protein DFH09DRAFT_1088262 [Mycena vulgaris]
MSTLPYTIPPLSFMRDTPKQRVSKVLKLIDFLEEWDPEEKKISHGSLQAKHLALASGCAWMLLPLSTPWEDIEEIVLKASGCTNVPTGYSEPSTTPSPTTLPVISEDLLMRSFESNDFLGYIEIARRPGTRSRLTNSPSNVPDHIKDILDDHGLPPETFMRACLKTYCAKIRSCVADIPPEEILKRIRASARAKRRAMRHMRAVNENESAEPRVLSARGVSLKPVSFFDRIRSFISRSWNAREDSNWFLSRRVPFKLM